MIEQGVHSPVVEWALAISTVLVLAGFVLAFVRMVKGPTLVDRVISVDLITVLAVGVAGLVSISIDQRSVVDVAAATALVAFLATVAFAWFVNKRADQLHEGDPSGPDSERGGEE